mmetsp:Transcript_72360/g.121454  ORF Transcript_72360/g.121454 Transcript_72360/m.121454 type:complete len:213 (+) Transcript_72360:487-1125(+)
MSCDTTRRRATAESSRKWKHSPTGSTGPSCSMATTSFADSALGSVWPSARTSAMTSATKVTTSACWFRLKVMPQTLAIMKQWDSPRWSDDTGTLLSLRQGLRVTSLRMYSSVSGGRAGLTRLVTVNCTRQDPSSTPAVEMVNETSGRSRHPCLKALLRAFSRIISHAIGSNAADARLNSFFTSFRPEANESPKSCRLESVKRGAYCPAARST